MQKYKTFVEILESADREKAVFSSFFKGIKEDISYGTFLDTIRSYPEIKGKTFAFLGDNSFSSILLLFILAYQKKTIVLLNPLEDEKLRKEKLNSLPFDGRVKGNQRILIQIQKRMITKKPISISILQELHLLQKQLL